MTTLVQVASMLVMHLHAEYTYDSGSVTSYNYSDPTHWSRYLISTVPLLSLVLSSGTVNHTFDLSTASNALQWYDIQA